MLQLAKRISEQPFCSVRQTGINLQDGKVHSSPGMELENTVQSAQMTHVATMAFTETGSGLNAEVTTYATTVGADGLARRMLKATARRYDFHIFASGKVKRTLSH